MFPLILLIAAFLLFLLGAIGVSSGDGKKFNLQSAGLACWVLSQIVASSFGG